MVTGLLRSRNEDAPNPQPALGSPDALAGFLPVPAPMPPSCPPPVPISFFGIITIILIIIIIIIIILFFFFFGLCKAQDGIKDVVFIKVLRGESRV